MTNPYSLDCSGLNALVVGASVRGAAVAAALTGAGATVVLADGKATLDAFSDTSLATGAASSLRPVDLDDPDALSGFVAEIDEETPLDAVFAVAPAPSGAGYVGIEGRIESIDNQTWHAAVADALHMPFHVIRSAAGPLRRRHAGSITIVTSTGARRTDVAGGYGDIAGAAGIVNAARQAAFALGADGVRVNVLVLGALEDEVAADDLERASAAIPMGRVATPADLVGIVTLLASPASSYMSGAVISLDGGALTRQNTVPRR